MCVLDQESVRISSKALVAIVTIQRKRDFAQVAALLAHVWQQVCELIGEKEPSPEFEAYTIQYITYNLLEQYREQSPSRRSRSSDRQ